MIGRKTVPMFALAVLAIVAPGCRHKYANKIDKDTQQPDKVLYDTAVKYLEKGQYERSRLTLQTLMNTYDTSEYMAKAKLAIADGWYRQGGGLGYAQAEAEYKDFILFYPNMEEAAESQSKICDMQFKQMEKPDRDPVHALRAEEECRTLVTQFPNSKYAPEGIKRLLQIQEVRGESEFRVGNSYYKKGSLASAANRFQGLADQFPIYSQADEALWLAAEAYRRLGDRVEDREIGNYERIVRDYPLSPRADDAKARLEAKGRAVPEANPEAYARMKYEQENKTDRSLLGKIWGPFSGSPDITKAAKSGTPQMTTFRPLIPLSVPAAAGGALGVTDVGVAVPADPNAIDQQPDARAHPPTEGGTEGQTAAPATTTTTDTATTPASNQKGTPAKKQDNKKKQDKKKK